MADPAKKFYQAEDVSAAAQRYGWPALLMRFGIDHSFLRNSHGPCPGCGGKDRFRFDDNDGKGTFICSQGGGDILSGDGITLLMHAKRWEFVQCLKELGDFLDVEPGAPPKDYAPRTKPPPPPENPKFEESSLKSFALRWRAQVDTAWLADRSSLDPFMLPAHDFLRALYREGEKIIVFTNQNSQGQAVWPQETIPASGPEGVWLLAQPTDGKEYENPRAPKNQDGSLKMSRRSEESVTSWRFLVLESDEADARDWIAALVQLPLAIAAIYTSGKRSIHALVRVDEPSLNEWRNFARAIQPILVKLGADRQVLASAVRLSRLPGCYREGQKNKESGEYKVFPRPQLQKLLYLNPAAEIRPICRLPKLRNSIATWAERARRFLPPDIADIVEKANAQNLDELIVALEYNEEEISKNDFSLGDCVSALEWFSTNALARELLDKLRVTAK